MFFVLFLCHFQSINKFDNIKKNTQEPSWVFRMINTRQTLSDKRRNNGTCWMALNVFECACHWFWSNALDKFLVIHRHQHMFHGRTKEHCDWISSHFSIERTKKVEKKYTLYWWIDVISFSDDVQWMNTIVWRLCYHDSWIMALFHFKANVFCLFHRLEMWSHFNHHFRFP